METKVSPLWLQWAREIQALSQTGAHYAENHYQLERYQRLSEIAAEIIQQHTSLDASDLSALFQAQTGYATPRVDVRGAVFQDNKLLLVQERADGGWTMPGGWADVGDIPSQAAEREVWEEAGFRVKAHKLIGVYDANRHGPLELFHAYKLVFLCDLIDGEARPSVETTQVAFFAQDELPQVLSGERSKPQQIAHAFAAAKDDAFETFFD